MMMWCASRHGALRRPTRRCSIVLAALRGIAWKVRWMCAHKIAISLPKGTVEMRLRSKRCPARSEMIDLMSPRRNSNSLELGAICASDSSLPARGMI
jgi:hypothetical protein